jgi:hypothetical protein
MGASEGCLQLPSSLPGEIIAFSSGFLAGGATKVQLAQSIFQHPLERSKLMSMQGFQQALPAGSSRRSSFAELATLPLEAILRAEDSWDPWSPVNRAAGVE